MYGVAVRKARAGGWGDDSVLGTLSGQVEGSTAESTYIVVRRRNFLVYRGKEKMLTTYVLAEELTSRFELERCL